MNPDIEPPRKKRRGKRAAVMLETDLAEAQEIRTTFERSKRNEGYVERNITIPYHAAEPPQVEPAEVFAPSENHTQEEAEAATLNNDDIDPKSRTASKVRRHSYKADNTS